MSNEDKTGEAIHSRAAMPVKKIISLAIALLGGVALVLLFIDQGQAQDQSAVQTQGKKNKVISFDDQIGANTQRMIEEGRQIFRFDTFGDEAFWGDMLKLHQAIEGSKFGGLGQGLTPSAALTLGLKVDMDALPKSVVKDLEKGRVDLNDPASTLVLLKANAVIGITGFFNQDGSLRSMGIQCAICHSTSEVIRFTRCSYPSPLLCGSFLWPQT